MNLNPSPRVLLNIQEPTVTDGVFLAHFEACTLTAADWTHEAHVRMAWLYLNRFPEAAAIEKIRAGIQRFNNAVLHKANGYHETITIAFTRLIADRLTSVPSANHFSDFKSKATDLLDRQLTALLRHYRRDTLFSDAARLTFVPPDLLALPNMARPAEPVNQRQHDHSTQ